MHGGGGPQAILSARPHNPSNTLPMAHASAPTLPHTPAPSHPALPTHPHAPAPLGSPDTNKGCFSWVDRVRPLRELLLFGVAVACCWPEVEGAPSTRTELSLWRFSWSPKRFAALPLFVVGFYFTPPNLRLFYFLVFFGTVALLENWGGLGEHWGKWGGEWGLCVCLGLTHHSRRITASPIVCCPREYSLPSPERFCQHASLRPAHAPGSHPSDFGGQLRSAPRTVCRQRKPSAPDGHVRGHHPSTFGGNPPSANGDVPHRMGRTKFPWRAAPSALPLSGLQPPQPCPRVSFQQVDPHGTSISNIQTTAKPGCGVIQRPNNNALKSLASQRPPGSAGFTHFSVWGLWRPDFYWGTCRAAGKTGEMCVGRIGRVSQHPLLSSNFLPFPFILEHFHTFCIMHL